MRLLTVEYENGRLRFTFMDYRGHLKYFAEDVPKGLDGTQVAGKLRKLSESMDR
jgi:hypothetical protein